MPPFFLARPRRWTMEPREGFALVMLQIRLIKFPSFKGGGELGEPAGAGQANCAARLIVFRGSRLELHLQLDMIRRTVRRDHAGKQREAFHFEQPELLV